MVEYEAETQRPLTNAIDGIMACINAREGPVATAKGAVLSCVLLLEFHHNCLISML